MKVEHLHSIDKDGIADDSATGSDKLATETAGSNKGVPLAGGARVMPPPDAPRDPFAPERFQIAQDYTALVGGTKQITRVPVGRPDSQLWFHVNPDSAFTVDVALLDLRNERETYIVDPALAIEVPTEVVTKRLYQYVTRQGDVGIWAIKLPDPEGRIDSYNESAMLAVETARQRWIRLVSNQRVKCYESLVTNRNYGEPDFGSLSLRDLLAIAFRGKVIDSINHPVLRRLRGEV